MDNCFIIHVQFYFLNNVFSFFFKLVIVLLIAFTIISDFNSIVINIEFLMFIFLEPPT